MTMIPGARMRAQHASGGTALSSGKLIDYSIRMYNYPSAITSDFTITLSYLDGKIGKSATFDAAQ
jgi:hypothetical protein